MSFVNTRTLAGLIGAAGVCASAMAGGGTPPPNNLCGDATIVECGRTAGTNVDATGGGLASCPVGGASFSSDDVWFEFVAPETRTYRIDTLGSSFDTVLAVFTGCEGSEIACNDDANQVLQSAVEVLLSSGQRVLINVAGWAGANGSIVLNINCEFGEEPTCCEPWDNGDFDRVNAQTSQIGFGEDYRLVGRVTADDFWLCEGNVYKINTLSGKLNTDSVVPKADVIIFEDCDGLPGRPVAAAFSIAPDPELIEGFECSIGSVTLTETGETLSDGTRVISVNAAWDSLWLKGGQYWVTIYGFSGTGDPDEQFFWGTSRNGVVQGRPGHFLEVTNLGELNWIPIDEVCCGCTDFNFCVLGEECKILLDNGGPSVFRSEYFPGAPSLQNGSNVASKVRSADQFVVPPCIDRELCYIEAWVYTNCDRVSIDLYGDECHLPYETPAPLATWNAECIYETGIENISDGVVSDLRLVKAVFFGFEYTLDQGRNYWLSAYGQGDNRQGARAYFSFNDYCDRECDINFDPGATKGPPYASSHWRAGTHDFAFLVAVHPVEAEEEPDPGVGGQPACAPDVNRDGRVSVQDLFDYLQAYFTGCP